MIKLGIGLLFLAVLSVMTAATVQQGCQDVRRAWTHLDYYPIRDMRHTVVLLPQKGFTRLPDSTSIPVNGREREDVDRDVLAATLVNPTLAADMDSSVARGEIKFQKNCIPCHGKSMDGTGPVAALFMPPPDLLAEATRGRKDGYIYSYIRHGGIVMPSYGPAVTPAEAWDLINYIRHMQRVSPR